MHAHHERQLDLLLRAVELDVVLDLDARCAVARDELLTAAAHVTTSLLVMKNDRPCLPAGLLGDGPPQYIDLRHGVRNQFLDDVDEIHRHEALAALHEQRNRARWLVRSRSTR